MSFSLKYYPPLRYLFLLVLFVIFFLGETPNLYASFQKVTLRSLEQNHIKFPLSLDYLEKNISVTYFPEIFKGSMAKVTVIVHFYDADKKLLSIVTYVLNGTNDHGSHQNTVVNGVSHITYIRDSYTLKTHHDFEIQNLLQDQNKGAIKLGAKPLNRKDVKEVSVVLHSWFHLKGNIKATFEGWGRYQVGEVAMDWPDPFKSFYHLLFPVVFLLAGTALIKAKSFFNTVVWESLVWVLLIGGLMGTFYWVFAGYLFDHSWEFYIGSLSSAFLLMALSNFGLKNKNSALLILANTLIFFTVSLLFYELFKPSNIYEEVKSKDKIKPIFSFKDAKGDYKAFSLWWEAYIREWARFQVMFQTYPDEPYKFLLKPSSEVSFFDSIMSTNSLGFRDEEFSVDKGNHYRIIALGGSTTMGMTIHSDETTLHTWPKVLQRLIAERMECERPVQVINAGIGAYNVRQQLDRYYRDLNPLQADMFISYQGINGFFHLYEDFPSIFDKNPPRRIDRPSTLLAELEFRFKLMRFRSRHEHTSFSGITMEDILNAKLAKFYEEFFELSRKHNFKVVMGTFNMAVDESSPEEARNFYKRSYPDLFRILPANIWHNNMVRKLVELNPDIYLAETGEGLDGVYMEDNFIDLVHFTQMGRDRLANNFFMGIKDLLKEENNCNLL